MTFPTVPLVVNGGCCCKAIRYKIDVPAFSERPANPYRIQGSEIGDLRIPMTAICHCNDCRRATASILPMALVADISTITASCVPRRSRVENSDAKWLPAVEIFDYTSDALDDVFLTFYKSSAGRTRWFCARCGTNLAYSVDPGVIPAEWGWTTRMLDLWLGTVDRDDLNVEGMAPERQLWCDKGVQWIRRFANSGAGGIPQHPLTKINDLAED